MTDDLLRPPRPPTAGLSMVSVTAVIYTGLAVLAVGWGVLDGWRNIAVHPDHRLGWAHLQGHTLWGAVAGLAFGALVVGLSRLTTRWFGWGKRLHMEFHEVLRGLPLSGSFAIAFFSALGEEAMFRGAMQPTLGIWITSVVFGLLHMPVRRGLWPWPFLAFAMGLCFGWLYEWSGDLLAPFIAHFTINFVNLQHIARVRYPGFEPPDPEPPAPVEP